MAWEKNLEKAVLGHKNILKYLAGSIREGKISHAYLFVGPEGVGKKHLATHFINAILEAARDNSGKENPSCAEENLAKNPDFHLVEKESGKNLISIEQIRALIHDLSLKPHHSPYKFALINNAELLTKEAANSFLKTLEEPSKKTIIILIASRESLIPETIKSRCQIIRFNNLSPEEIFQHLKKQGLNPSRAKNFSLLAQGRPGVAINFLLQPEKYEAYRQNIADFIDLFEANIPQKFIIIGELKKHLAKADNSSEEVQKIMLVWLAVLRDMLLNEIELKAGLVHLGKEAQYRRLAKNQGPLYFTFLLNQLITALGLLKRNVNYHLVLENFVLKI